MEKIHTEVYKGYTINIYPDTEPMSPIDWGFDGLFLVGFDPKHFWVHRDGFSQGLVESIVRNGKHEDGSIDYRAKDIMKKYHCFILEAYIHSGVSLALVNEGTFPDRQWDVCVVGAVFVSKDEAKTKNKARILASTHIETWNDYLSGCVYGYTIDDIDDSFFGFYGNYEDGALAEAKSVVDSILETQEEHKNCPHEDTILYGELLQEDGIPQYKVVCSTCQKRGRILLEEGKNDWEL